MEEDDFCPYCDELVTFEFSSDYYMDEGVTETKCPECGEEVEMTWEISHAYHFSKKEANNG